ncbi:hypothetical protein O3P69_015341 [Scylla paramamosain]|uniref:Uncharacterized protein n=1 Tax=Scylla paramamosain TaxID=85552 RepID=A0AAW0T452_SCYPA
MYKSYERKDEGEVSALCPPRCSGCRGPLWDCWPRTGDTPPRLTCPPFIPCTTTTTTSTSTTSAVRSTTPRQAPPGVRPVLLTRPLARPDPRPPSRPHPYSLLYLHYVPLAHLTARDPEYRSSRREEPQPATSTSLRPALR